MSITKLNCMELKDTRYSVYPYDGYNLEEILGKFYEAIKECNDLSFSLQEFNTWLIDTGLLEEVEKQLTKIDWDNIVNSELYQRVLDKLNETKKQLETIVNNKIDNNFKKGTSFFCFTDEATRKYLINQPSRIENYKKCGIEEIFLYLVATFDGHTISTNISNSILLEASNLLKSNGFKVGIKINDSGVGKINSDNYKTWFSEKTRILKEACNVVGNPTQINIANENPATNVVEYRSEWEKLVSVLKSNYPNTLLSVHTYFSDYYHGKIIVADLVDLLGVNYYPYTTDNAVPTSEEVKKAIYKPINGVPFFDTMQEYCKKYNNKFIISEWGTASFEYQCKNPAEDYIKQNEKVLNPQVQAIFISEACRLFPYIDNCYGMYLWSSNCWRNLDTDFERSWAWDESEATINAISSIWGGK